MSSGGRVSTLSRSDGYAHTLVRAIFSHKREMPLCDEKKLASMGESARTRWGHIMAEDTLSTKAHPNQAATAAAAKKRKQPAN